MKFTSVILSALFTFLSATYADIPSPFDPRPQNQKTVQGCGFIVHPFPLTSNYLIITQPFEQSSNHSFLTFEATVTPSLKLDDLVGKFVLIKAERIEMSEKSKASLQIISVTPISKW